MPHTFRSQQWLPYPIELVFAFFANPENLPRLMPPWRKARIEEASFAPPPPRPIAPDPALRLKSAAGPGTRLTLSFRPFPYSPVRVPWESQIDSFSWNSHFSDLQLRGPFAYWRHRHNFLAETRFSTTGTPTPGTLLTDEVEYGLPYGILGDLAQRLFIARQLRSTFAYRHQRTLAIFTRIAATR